MRLYLFRHAEASYDAPSDFDRELTDRGRQRTRTAAQVMGRLDIAPRNIVSSPRVRARQTAEIVAEVLGVPLMIDEGLNFGFNVRVAATILRETMPDDVMVVGHNPSFEQVIQAMSGANVTVKKGALVRIDVSMLTNPLRGELVWLIAPKVFDALES